MSIETLDDILDEFADRMSVYGSHIDEDAGEMSDDPDPFHCRCCFVAHYRHRLKQAVEVENALAAGRAVLSAVAQPK